MSRSVEKKYKKFNEKFQLVPPHIQRRNTAERAISSFKDHFFEGLGSVHKDFPLHLWCKLVPHAVITLNLMRQSRINPMLSAHAVLHGKFNYDTTPLAPPGTKIIAYKNPAVRGTWATHAKRGWYLGPSMDHYRCHLCYIIITRGERDSDCVAFFHTTLHFRTALLQKVPLLQHYNYPMHLPIQLLELLFPTLAMPKLPQ